MPHVKAILAAVLIWLACLPASGDDALPVLKRFIEEMVEITPGEGRFPAEFRMGSTADPSEQPVHSVRLQHTFAIARYEVPQNLYEAVMGHNPSRWTGPRNSVEMMTWQQANSFCEKITQRLRQAKLIDADEVIRLPSEAEWEYCCRAGTTTAYSSGDKATAVGDTGNNASLLDPYAWHTGNAAGNDPPVGELQPNAWGLYDMHGYLREFTADAWHADYEGARSDGSPRAPADGQSPRQIAVRGGSWKDAWPDLRSASRRPFDVTGQDDAVGFRCVRVRSR